MQLGNWEKLTKDNKILQIVKGYQIPFFYKQKQKREPKEINFSMQEKTTIPLEVENLSKGAVEQVFPHKDLFLRSLVTLKKDGSKRPMINFKELNQFIPFLHFKMENLQLLKTLLQKKLSTCAN